MTAAKFPTRTGLILIILLLALPAAGVSAQEIDGEYSNGHNVTGEFLAFYNSVPDPLLIFGYPITEAFTDPSGNVMQYFQRARFDLVDGQIVVAPLGRWLYDEDAPVEIIETNSTFCEDFSTDFKVCYEFLLFYEQHNGAKYFGKPISPLFQVTENAPSMQYFENVRMEYHPEAPTGEKISLSYLGRMHFDDQFDNPDMLHWTNNLTNAPAEQITLNVNAFVRNALSQVNSQQTLYVIVQDEQFQPIPQARTSVIMHFPDGSVSDEIVLSPTDENGVTRHYFPVPSYAIDEIIQIEVNASFNGNSTASTTTWFRIWW